MTTLVKRSFYLLRVDVCKASLLTVAASINPCLKICQLADLKCRIFQQSDFCNFPVFLFLRIHLNWEAYMGCKCFCMFFGTLHHHKGQHSSAVVICFICMFSRVSDCVGFLWSLHSADYDHTQDDWGTLI